MCMDEHRETTKIVRHGSQTTRENLNLGLPEYVVGVSFTRL